MAKAFLTQKRDHVKTQANTYFYISSGTTLNGTFSAKYNGAFPRTLYKWDKNQKFTSLRKMTSIPAPSWVGDILNGSNTLVIVRMDVSGCVQRETEITRCWTISKDALTRNIRSHIQSVNIARPWVIAVRIMRSLTCLQCYKTKEDQTTLHIQVIK